MTCLIVLHLRVVYLPSLIVFCIDKLNPQMIVVYHRMTYISKMEDWAISNTWRMVFNIDKCEVL